MFYDTVDQAGTPFLRLDKSIAPIRCTLRLIFALRLSNHRLSPHGQINQRYRSSLTPLRNRTRYVYLCRNQGTLDFAFRRVERD